MLKTLDGKPALFPLKVKAQSKDLYYIADRSGAVVMDFFSSSLHAQSHADALNKEHFTERKAAESLKIFNELDRK